IPWSAPRSASQDQGNRHAAARTICAREGVMAWSSASGGAGMFRCTSVSPACSRLHRDMVRAWRAIPQENGCCWVENRLEVSSVCVTRVCHSQQTTVVCWGGGLNKYQRHRADCLQRPLVSRSRFQQQLMPGVRCFGKAQALYYGKGNNFRQGVQCRCTCIQMSTLLALFPR